MEKNKNIIQIIKFTLFSISAGVIQVSSFTLLNLVFTSFKGKYGINYIISVLCSIVWNFTFNRKFTFNSSKDIKKSMFLVLLFYLVFIPVSTIIGTHFEQQGVNEYIVLAVTMIFNFVLEFIYSKNIVFKEKKK